MHNDAQAIAVRSWAQECVPHPDSQAHLNHGVCSQSVLWVCSARDTGVNALRMEALAPSAKRSKTAGDANAQPEAAASKK